MFKLNNYPLWVFLVAISINIFFAQQRIIAFKTYLDLTIPMFCLYYIIPESISTDKQFYNLSKVICILSSLVALGGLMDFLLGSNFIYEYFIPNTYYQKYKSIGFMYAISTQFNYPPLGSYLIASLPFSFLFIRQNKLPTKLLGIFCASLITLAAILTFSRGAFLGLAAMVVFILYISKKRFLLLIFAIIFCLFILFCSYVHHPVNRLGLKQLLFYGRTSGFSEYRCDRIFMTLQMLRDHPFVGLGFKHFRILFNEYYTGKIITPYEFMIADNMYLTLLAETGTFGFTGFLIFVASVIKKAWRKITVLNVESLNRWYLVIALSGIIGLLVNMAAYELFYWPNQYIYLCILFGCMNALLKKNDD